MSYIDNDILSILKPCKDKYPHDYLIYTFIEAIETYQIKTKQPILNIQWNYYGYSNTKCASYSNIYFTINNIKIKINFGRCLDMISYNVPSKNGICSISINDKTYYINDSKNGFFMKENPTKYIDLSDDIESFITSLN